MLYYHTSLTLNLKGVIILFYIIIEYLFQFLTLGFFFPITTMAQFCPFLLNAVVFPSLYSPLNFSVLLPSAAGEGIWCHPLQPSKALLKFNCKPLCSTQYVLCTLYVILRNTLKFYLNSIANLYAQHSMFCVLYMSFYRNSLKFNLNSVENLYAQHSIFWVPYTNNKK